MGDGGLLVNLQVYHKRVGPTLYHQHEGALVATVLCSSDNRGGMKRRDKKMRKQPSGDRSSGENPGILL